MLLVVLGIGVLLSFYYLVGKVFLMVWVFDVGVVVVWLLFDVLEGGCGLCIVSVEGLWWVSVMVIVEMLGVVVGCVIVVYELLCDMWSVMLLCVGFSECYV